VVASQWHGVANKHQWGLGVAPDELVEGEAHLRHAAMMGQRNRLGDSVRR
jgi:hypothetical protein